MDHEAMIRRLAADLDNWLDNVKSKVLELKTLPDSPERQVEMDLLRSSALELQRSLDDLVATIKRKRNDQIAEETSSNT